MNIYPDIDFGAFQIKIEEKAQILLNNVTEENLKYFSEEVKKIAEATLENYVFQVYDIYVDGARKITDLSVLEEFTNYTNGYQSQMLSWSQAHPIMVKEQVIEMPDIPSPSGNNVDWKPVLAIGTVIAVCLFIFSNVWVALAAELLTIALCIYRIKVQNKSNLEFEAEVADYERTLQKKKRDLINGLTNELEDWLKQGKTHSDEILKSFNL